MSPAREAGVELLPGTAPVHSQRPAGFATPGSSCPSPTALEGQGSIPTHLEHGVTMLPSCPLHPSSIFPGHCGTQVMLCTLPSASPHDCRSQANVGDSGLFSKSGASSHLPCQHCLLKSPCRSWGPICTPAAVPGELHPCIHRNTKKGVSWCPRGLLTSTPAPPNLCAAGGPPSPSGQSHSPSAFRAAEPWVQGSQNASEGSPSCVPSEDL